MGRKQWGDKSRNAARAPLSADFADRVGSSTLPDLVRIGPQDGPRGGPVGVAGRLDRRLVGSVRTRKRGPGPAATTISDRYEIVTEIYKIGALGPIPARFRLRSEVVDPSEERVQGGLRHRSQSPITETLRYAVTDAASRIGSGTTRVCR